MRFYDVGGKFLPSVTTILSIVRKPALETWRGELGNEEADRLMHEAGDMGSSVHTLCEAVHYGVPWCSNDPNIVAMVESYERWFNTYVRKVLHVEKLVVNLPYGYAGRVDLVAVLKGDRLPSVIDLKTGKGIWPEMPLQLSAYKEALPFKTKRRVIVHLDKVHPGRLATKDDSDFSHDHGYDYRMFLYAKELWTYFNGAVSPRKEDIIKPKETEYERDSTGTGS